jgi:formylglycine-generating enzyme required for sulfatase activity
MRERRREVARFAAIALPVLCAIAAGSGPIASDARQDRGRAAAAGADRTLRLPSVSSLPAGGKRYAVLVGVDEYDDQQFTTLKGAANDARALADALARFAGFPRENIVVLATGEARAPTRPNIIDALSNVRGVVPSDGLLLVSFSGHGIERGGRAFLLPSDARASSLDVLEQTAVPVAEVRRYVERAGAQQVVVLLDACRNDPTAGRSAADVPHSRAFEFSFDAANRDIRAFATIYATSERKRAFEYDAKGQGYFTWAVVEGLKGAAADSAGRVTLQSLLAYVEETVPKLTNLNLGAERRQVPFHDIQGYRASELVLSVPAAAAAQVSPGMSRPPARAGAARTERLPDGTAFEMVRIPAGRFLMGSDVREDEGPVRPTTIERPFEIGRCEVTRGVWRAVMGSDGAPGDADLPVDSVSWEEAQNFVERLNFLTSRSYRLPTEAEWEYACRAGSLGDSVAGLTASAWFLDNSGDRSIDGDAFYRECTSCPDVAVAFGCRSHPVGKRDANAWGLFDMLGNVAEWCQDPYARAAAGDDTREMAVRGGSWADGAASLRPAFRTALARAQRDRTIGLRLASAL